MAAKDSERTKTLNDEVTVTEVNNNSSEHAAELLFAFQAGTAGSGYLEDYIDHLERPGA